MTKTHKTYWIMTIVIMVSLFILGNLMNEARDKELNKLHSEGWNETRVPIIHEYNCWLECDKQGYTFRPGNAFKHDMCRCWEE